jgi:UDP-N-acetylmuramoylalanine--D-glutamate ligase
MPLIGKHNEDNMCAALAVGLTLGIEKESIEASLLSFRGLPHRLEYVATKDSILFYDDAISTTPQSTMAALDALRDVDTIFLGGTDRGYDFRELTEKLESMSLRNIVFFPPSGKRIRESLELMMKESKKSYNFLETSSMKEAVDFAFANTEK